MGFTEKMGSEKGSQTPRRVRPLRIRNSKIKIHKNSVLPRTSPNSWPIVNLISGWLRNRKPEPETGPSEPFVPKPKAEREPPEQFSRNQKRNRDRLFLLTCTETQNNSFLAEEPPEPKIGTARTVPAPSCNRTEPNASLLYICVTGMHVLGGFSQHVATFFGRI